MEQKRKKRHTGLKILLIFVLIAVVLVVDSNFRIVTDEFILGNSRLPEGAEGLRIVHLSDLHARRFGSGNSRLVSAVRDAEPDMICITGDMVDGPREEQEDYVRELMGQLTQIAPVYFVPGNHEWAAGWARELFTILREEGVTVLRNSYVTFGRGGDYIVIAGVDDPNGLRGQSSPEKMMEEIRADHGDSYVLLLAHRDTELELWSQLGFDAVLCGHAHGGLIRLPFTDGLVAPAQGLFPTWTAGIYTQGGTQMLVSRGFAGSHGCPRVFNNPEVVSITLSRQ